MPDRQPIRPATLTLHDLVSDLTWPTLLRAPRLALRPARVGIALAYLLGVIALGALGNWLDGAADVDRIAQGAGNIVNALKQAASSLFSGQPSAAANGLHIAFLTEPLATLRAAPIATVLIVPLLVAWTALMGAAISRTAATELAWSRTTTWPAAMGMALERWKTLFATVFVPLALVWVVSLAISVGGILLRWPWLNVLGALLFGVAILAALVCAVLVLGFLGACAMLVPASVCEGADTFDSLQHAYALAFARPVRLLGYLAVVVAQGVLFAVAIGVLMWLTLGIAQGASATFSGVSGGGVVSVVGALPSADGQQTASRSEGIAGKIVGEWTKLFRLIGLAVLISYGWCAATALFLAMRRVCDGQELSELWQPGMVGGTMAEVGRPRGATIAGIAVSTPSTMRPNEAILDNGPADEP